MKRLAFVLGGVVIAGAALLLLIVVLLPRDVLKTRIGEQIAGWTGRDVSLSGNPRIGIFPLSVTLDDVQVSGPDGMQDAQIVSMDRLKGTIRILPLIIGRVEIDSFTMVRPLIRLVRDGAGERNWEFDSGAAALQLAFAGDVPLGEFRLEGGTVTYEDRATGDTDRLDSVNLSVNWTSVRKPIQISGSGIWRGESVSFLGRAQAPFAFLKGQETPLDLRIESAPIKVALTGTARDYPRTALSGDLELSAPSLRRFASWLGSPIGPGSTLGPASLSGAATFSDNVLSVENAELTLDGNSASGALKITPGQRPDVAGTLAFGALDLSPYFAGLSAALSVGPDWRRVAVATDWLGDMSADVRLSADTVKLGPLNAGSTAASVSLSDGRLELGLARAVFDQGSLSGDLTVADAKSGPGAEINAQLRASDIALDAAGALLGLPQGTSGTASATVDVAASGRDLGSLVESLAGNADLRVEDGAVPLFGLAEIAASSGSASTAPEPIDLGPKPIQSAELALSLGGGMGTVSRAKVVTGSYAAAATGWLRLSDGALALNGALQPGAPDAPAGTPVPFTIEGTLGRPVARRQALAN